MEYFKKFNQDDLVNLIHSTENELYISLPSIHSEIADAITSLDRSKAALDKEVNIHILIDFDAQTFRQGYGNYESVNELIKGGFKIKRLKDNRISFIIADDIGYYISVESRSMIPANKVTINSVRIDPISMVRLKHYFFSEANSKTKYENELTNAIIEESKQLDHAKELLVQETAQVEEVESAELEEVISDLRKNPPLNPDYERVVSFYKTKFQYVQLKFNGANLQHLKLKLPQDVLPIRDANLLSQLQTHLNLFEKERTDEWIEPLRDLKQEVEKVRETYLKKVKSRTESLLDLKDKNSFVKSVEELTDQSSKTRNDMIESLNIEILHTKEILKNTLIQFFEENKEVLKDESPNIFNADKNYVEKLVQNKAESIIYKIKWPTASTLLSKFKFEVKYSDITYEDLKNQEFIKELVEKEFISEEDTNALVEFSERIEMRP